MHAKAVDLTGRQPASTEVAAAAALLAWTLGLERKGKAGKGKGGCTSTRERDARCRANLIGIGPMEAGGLTLVNASFNDLAVRLRCGSPLG